MKHDDEAHKFYYPVEGRGDGAIGGAAAFLAIILVPAGIYMICSVANVTLFF